MVIEDGSSQMLAEITEIPAVVERALRDGAADIEAAAASVSRRWPRFVMIVGRGTSDNAGMYARYLLETALGLPVGLAAPSAITICQTQLDWRDVLLLAVSQSGEALDVAEVTHAARLGGALTIAVTNEPASPLTEEADAVLLLHAGKEEAVAATKTYVASLAVLASLVCRLAPRATWSALLPRLPDALSQSVEAGKVWLAGQAAEAIPAFAGAQAALVISRGHNLATALELALKFKETGRVFAHGYSSADLLHGPLALAGPDVPTLVARPDGPLGASIDEAMAVCREAGTTPWWLGGAEIESRPRSLVLPACPEPLSPLVLVIPGLLLVEAVARARGRNPDAPPGLTKVTRTR